MSRNSNVEYTALAAALTHYYCNLACAKANKTRMWANAQRDGRPAEYRWRLLFNAAKFG